MSVRVVTVFHGQKVDGLASDLPVEVRANPNLSVPGMVHIQSIVEAIRGLSPFAGPIYSSRLTRALDTASVLALALDMDIVTLPLLGQNATADKVGGEITHYPGSEGENYCSWQTGGVLAIQELYKKHGSNSTVLVVSHRPVIGGLVALSKGVTGDNDAIKAIVSEIANNKEIMRRGYITFEASTDTVKVAD